MQLIRESKRPRLTRAMLAEYMDTTETTIYRLETGRMQMTQNWAERIAHHMGCSIAELMGEKPAHFREVDAPAFYRRAEPRKQEPAAETVSDATIRAMELAEKEFGTFDLEAVKAAAVAASRFVASTGEVLTDHLLRHYLNTMLHRGRR